VALNPALPFWKMLPFVFLPTILGTSNCLVFVPLINTVLLDAPMLPTRWVKISTYLQSETFLSIIFLLINLKLLIIFVHTPDVLCYVVLSYHVLVNTRHLPLFDCLFTFWINMLFPPVLACNLSLTLCCVCPYYNYLYLHCAVSVIGFDLADIYNIELNWIIHV
jgi:hypothetical protein